MDWVLEQAMLESQVHIGMDYALHVFSYIGLSRVSAPKDGHSMADFQQASESVAVISVFRK